MTKQILLVGSNLDFYQEVKGNLETLGFEVQLCTDIQEATAWFFKMNPALIICDAQTENISGSELCRMVKNDAVGRQTIFFLVTHLPSQPEAINKLMRDSKPDDIISKPFTIEQIVTKTLLWLESKRSPLTVNRKQASVIKNIQDSLPYHGRLADFSIAKLLYQINHRRFNGELLLTDEQKKMRVTFQNGDPIMVRSNYIRDDSLGRMLVTEQKISPTQLKKAEELHRSVGVKIGKSLLTINALNEKELAQALVRQSYNKLLGVFQERWRDGEFTVEPGLFEIDLEQYHPMTTTELIQEGITRNFSLKRLLPLFQARNRMYRELRATSEMDNLYNKLLLNDQQRRIIEYVRRGVSVKQLEVLIGIDRTQFYQFLYLLLVMHAARFEPYDMHLELAEKMLKPADADHLRTPRQAKDPAVEYKRNFKLGESFFKTGDYRQAMTFLRMALLHKPECLNSLTMIGWSSFMQRTSEDTFYIEEAKEYLHKALHIDPRWAKAHYYLALIFKSQQQHDLAEKHTRKAFEFSPQDPDIQREYEHMKTIGRLHY